VVTAAPGQVILGIVSSGPWFLARLPVGMYTVQVAVVGSITPRQVAHVREDQDDMGALYLEWGTSWEGVVWRRRLVAPS
jgi:hypothetical protein